MLASLFVVAGACTREKLKIQPNLEHMVVFPACRGA